MAHPGATFQHPVRQPTKTAVSRDGEGDPEHFAVRQRRRQPVPLPLRPHRCGHRRLPVPSMSAAPQVFSEGRLHVERRLGDAVGKLETLTAGAAWLFPIVDVPATHPMFPDHLQRKALQCPRSASGADRAGTSDGIGKRR
jgi:hypothetical protein